MCKLLKAEKYTVYFPTWINTKKVADSSKFLTSADSEMFNVRF